MAAAVGEFPALELLLKSAIVAHLVSDTRDMIEIEPTKTLLDALDVMAQHQLMALPVYDPFAKEYEGIVTTFDIVLYVVFFGFNETTGELDADRLSTPVGSVIGFDAEIQLGKRRRGLMVVDARESVWEVMAIFSKGVDRVMVRMGDHTDEKQKFRLLTTSDIINFLVAHVEEIEDFAMQNVSDTDLMLPMAGNNIVTAHVSENTIAAFRSLYDSHADAVAIVDDTGAMVSWLSAGDLRGMKKDDFLDLLLPVKEFLEKRNFGKLRKPICVQPEDSIALMMTKASAIKTHRVWVIDEQHKPIGCVRLSDMVHLMRSPEQGKVKPRQNRSPMRSRRSSANPGRLSITDALFF